MSVPPSPLQAEVYRIDFQTEREEREKMAEERDRLLEEINNMRLSNQQLRDQMDMISTEQLHDLQRRHGFPAAGSPQHLVLYL